MISRILAVVTVVSASLLVILLFTTNPGSVGPAGLLLVFILGYLSLLGLVTFLLFYGVKLWVNLVRLITRRTVHFQLTFRRAYLYASILATLPMMVVGLYSTGGISWYELLLISLFGAIGVLYIAKRT